MLVITRREGEEVVIGDPKNPLGVVRIASIKGDRVRVAFDFPRTVEVHRREVADQIASGQDRVASGAPAVVVVAGRTAGASEAEARNGTDHRNGAEHRNGSTHEIEITIPLNGPGR